MSRTPTLKLLLLMNFLVTLLHGTILAQTDYCGENANGVYWPVKTGLKKFYMSTSGPSEEYYPGDSLQVDGKIYFKKITITKTSAGNISYWREEQGNVYFYDTAKKRESLELSANTIPGYSWEKYDHSWKYTVVDTSSKYSTPYCDFKNLLNIKAEPLGDTKAKYSDYYNLYYKRGIGMVCLDVSGKGYSFLSIDKSVVEAKNWIFKDCQSKKTEEKQNQCTADKMKEFFTINYNYSGDPKKGLIVIHFLIDEEGNVQDATIKQTIEGADGQAAEALRVVRLMKFIPMEINGKAHKSWVNYPVMF